MAQARAGIRRNRRRVAGANEFGGIHSLDCLRKSRAVRLPATSLDDGRGDFIDRERGARIDTDPEGEQATEVAFRSRLLSVEKESRSRFNTGAT
jgi:hypothetical protein